MCRIFHKPVFFGFCFAIFAILQVSVGIYIGGILTTLETQYRIRSSVAGLAISTSDIASLISILGVTYVGKSWHRPRMIGILALMTGVGGILSGVPHFLYPAYRDIPTGTTSGGNGTTFTSSITQCDVERGDPPECDTGGSRITEMWALFLGQAIMGIAYGPLFPIAVTYVDDQVRGTTTPYYISAFLIAGSAATIVGFGQAAGFLQLWVNWPAQFDGTREWIGAWWIGFMLDGIIIMVVGLIFFFFPKEMDVDINVEDIPKERLEKEGTTGQTVTALGVQDVMSSLKRICTNAVFMFLMLTTIFDLAVAASFGFFLPKFFEIRYNVPVWFAALLVGILVTPGTLIGNITSALIVKKMKLSSLGCGSMIVGLTTIVTLCIPVIYFLNCPETNYVGYTEGVLSTQTDCNVDCGCSIEQFQPVCVGGEHVFVTPCYAGCNSTRQEPSPENPNVNITVFTGCSCAAGLEFANGADAVTEAYPGKCEYTCDKIYYVGVLLFCIILFGSMAQNPLFTIQMRTTGKDKTFALGLAAFFSRALGFLPAPLYFGAAIDSACVLDRVECGERGDCLVYNSALFSLVFLGIFYALKLANLCFNTGATLAVVCQNKRAQKDENKNDDGMELGGRDNKGYDNHAM